MSAILHHIYLLRLLPKSYLKISTFQPNVLCSSSFKKHAIICESQLRDMECQAVSFVAEYCITERLIVN